MKYSVIDISSSSISMIVAMGTDSMTEVVLKERTPLGLLHYFADGELEERGRNKLIEVLTRFKNLAAEMGAQQCYLIATASLRHVKNFFAVAEEVYAATGLWINLLDGGTEAYCDYIANLYFKTYERPVLIDLGGKSIEICDLDSGKREDMVCFSFGLLDLYRKFIDNVYPTQKEAKAIKRYVRERFDEAKLPEAGAFATAVMVGASNMAMYDLYADYTKAKEAEGVRTIQRKKFKKLARHLIEGEDRSRLVLNTAPEKVYLIGSAAIVLKELFRRFDITNIVVSDRGVKEGYLQLVLDGKMAGSYFDFEAGAAVMAEPVKEEKPKRRRAAKKPPAKKEDAAPAKTEDAAPQPQKRRGRPKKVQAEPAPAAADDATQAQNTEIQNSETQNEEKDHE